MGESKAEIAERARSQEEFEFILAAALPHDTHIDEICEQGSIVRIGKRVRVYDVALTSEGQTTTRRFVAKKHTDANHARSSHLQLTRLRTHGFAPPSPFLVPKPVAWFGSTTIEEELAGTMWIKRPTPENSRRAAEWLVTLQKTSLVAAVGSPHQTPAPTDTWRAIAERIDERVAHTPDQLVASHGDFHPKNVKMGNGYVGVIDIDKIALREPAFDAGDAIAQLLVMSAVDGNPEDGRRGALEFWNGYRRSGFATAHRVCLHIARGLVATVAYKLALAHAAGEPEPPTASWALLAARFLDADDPARVLA
jgi:hypothetical protein